MQRRPLYGCLFGKKLQFYKIRDISPCLIKEGYLAHVALKADKIVAHPSQEVGNSMPATVYGFLFKPSRLFSNQGKNN